MGELVTYLAVADASIREEIVLKAAILAERYAKDLRWYVDTVLQLITIAGALPSIYGSGVWMYYNV